MLTSKQDETCPSGTDSQRWRDNFHLQVEIYMHIFLNVVFQQGLLQRRWNSSHVNFTGEGGLNNCDVSNKWQKMMRVIIWHFLHWSLCWNRTRKLTLLGDLLRRKTEWGWQTLLTQSLKPLMKTSSGAGEGERPAQCVETLYSSKAPFYNGEQQRPQLIL